MTKIGANDMDWVYVACIAVTVWWLKMKVDNIERYLAQIAYNTRREELDED